MDPDENLKQILRLSESIATVGDARCIEPYGVKDEVLAHEEEEAEELAEYVRNLDDWITKGGFLPKRWAKTCNGGLLSRANLAQKVYNKAFEATGSFEGELGLQLAYLFGAILKDACIELDVNNNVEQNEVLQLLEGIFDKSDAVWNHIKVLP